MRGKRKHFPSAFSLLFLLIYEINLYNCEHFFVYSQPNYWYLGLFKKCKFKENMHSVIAIKSQTIIKMMVFEKQYHSHCQCSSSPIALFLLRGGDRPPCPYCFLASEHLHKLSKGSTLFETMHFYFWKIFFPLPFWFLEHSHFLTEKKRDTKMQTEWQRYRRIKEDLKRWKYYQFIRDDLVLSYLFVIPIILKSNEIASKG